MPPLWTLGETKMPPLTPKRDTKPKAAPRQLWRA